MSRLEERLLQRMTRASRDFGLFEPNDRIMVCVSGGKDSHSLLSLLRALRPRLPFPISLVAVTLDQGQPGFPVGVLRDYFEREGFEHRIVERDTYSIVKEKIPSGGTYCSLCSRLRRAILYDAAVELGCTKVALGHHRDDVIETALMNLFYSGKLAAMPARLRSEDGRNVVIRPLIYCDERDVAAYAAERAFPILPCDLCGSQDNLHRKKMKALIADLAASNRNVKGSMLAALANVVPSHLLDPQLAAAWEQSRAVRPEDPYFDAAPPGPGTRNVPGSDEDGLESGPRAG